MAFEVTQRGAWTVGATATSAVMFTRPADSNQYTAGDVVADSTTAASILRFKGAARGVGLGGIIQSALLIDSVAAATKPDLEMYIFTQPPAMQADNAAWNPTDAEMLFCIGVIAFPLGSFKTAGANGIIEPSNPGQAFTCDPALTDIFGILVARNAYTPSSGEIFKILLQILQD